jgi:hypothetical protein
MPHIRTIHEYYPSEDGGRLALLAFELFDRLGSLLLSRQSMCVFMNLVRLGTGLRVQTSYPNNGPVTQQVVKRGLTRLAMEVSQLLGVL